MNRATRSFLLIACIAALAFALSGCQFIARKATESAISGATGGKVNVNGDSVTIKGEDGSQATIANETKLPADFPSDVPMMDGGTINAAITSKTDKGTAYMVSVKYKVPVSDVSDFYTAELAKGDWKTTSTVSTQDGTMVTADNGTTQVTVITNKSTESGFQSEANLQVGPKP